MVNLMSFKKLALVGLMLIAGSAGSMSYAQDDKNNEVSLVVSGEGPTKDEATKVALRSAIEQTYGTFVSSNTTILNDNLVKDEIVSVSTGNIKSFNYLSQEETNGKWSVSLQAIVSIGKLIEYAKSKGSEAELAGATFAMNIKIQQLNKKNQDIALEHLLSQLKPIIPTIFDYGLEVGEPKYVDHENLYFVPITIYAIANKNYTVCYELLRNTLNALSVPPSDVKMLIKQGFKFKCIHCYYPNGEDNEIRFYLHDDDKEHTTKFSSYMMVLRDEVFKNCCNFTLTDGINTYLPKLREAWHEDEDISKVRDIEIDDGPIQVLTRGSEIGALPRRTCLLFSLNDKNGSVLFRDKDIRESHTYIYLPEVLYKEENVERRVGLNKHVVSDSQIYDNYWHIDTFVIFQDDFDYYSGMRFPFFAPNHEGQKITIIDFLLGYTLDELSKISKFNIIPTYKK